MVTIQEATEQISKAEEQIEQQEKKLETAREEFIRETKPQAATIQRQLQLEKTFGRGAVGLFLEEERKIQKRGLPQLGKAEQELVRFREKVTLVKEEVGLAKAEVERVRIRNLAIRKQNEAIAKRNQDRATALKLFRKGGRISGESRFVQKLVQRLQEGQELQREQLIKEKFVEAGLEPIFLRGEIVGFSDIERKVDIPVEFIGEIGKERLSILEEKGVVTFEETKPLLTIEAREKPTDILGGAEFELRELRFGGTGIEKGLAGAGLALTGFLQFGKEFLGDPIGLGKKTIAGVGVFATRLASGEGFPQISRIITQEPEFATGFVAGEALIFKGFEALPKAALKVSDIVRTRRLKELKATDIVDPKFFLGETFPSIRKGETAGELLREFKPLLPGEIEAGGFTATATPFAKETIALKGTSELPGVFQSPLVSPRFLRVGGEAERKLFSLKIFDTPRPSIIRITPEEFKLVPGVSPAQTQISGEIRRTRQFFETAPKGKSFVPFIKTEKEAVIPFGTKLELIDKRFFIKFEGRRVPIFEFKTTKPGIGEGIKDFGKLPTIEDVSKSLSRVSGERGLVTPLSSISIGGVSRSISSPTRSSRAAASSSLVSRSARSSRISRISQSSIGSSFVGRPSRVGGISSGVSGVSRTFEFSGVSRVIERVGGIGAVTGITGRRRERRAEPKKKPKRKPRKTKIAPSFTSIVAELKGGIPEVKFIGKTEIGILPTQLRRLPGRRKLIDL